MGNRKRAILYLVSCILCDVFIPGIVVVCKISCSSLLLEVIIGITKLLIAIFIYNKLMINEVRSVKIDKLKDALYIGAILLFIVIVVSVVLSLFNIESSNQKSLDEMEKNNILLFGILAIILAPATEELVYRECIFSLFKKNRMAAAVVSVSAFAIDHVLLYIIQGEYTQFLAAISYVIIGIGLAYVYMKKGGVTYSIITHSFYNALPIILGMLI